MMEKFMDCYHCSELVVHVRKNGASSHCPIANTYLQRWPRWSHNYVQVGIRPLQEPASTILVLTRTPGIPLLELNLPLDNRKRTPGGVHYLNQCINPTHHAL